MAERWFNSLFGKVTPTPKPEAPPKEGPLFGEITTKRTSPAHVDDGMFGAAETTETSPELNADFSNWTEVAPAKIKEAYRGPKKEQFIQKMRADILRVTATGEGFDTRALPEHLIQRGDTCQTTAVMNGLLIALGPDEFRRRITGTNNIHSLIARYKQNVEARGLDSYIPVNSIEELQRNGHTMESVPLTGNPFETAKKLWAEQKQILIYTRNPEGGGMGHATLLLPVQNPTEARFMVQVDSLRTEKQLVSLGQFLQMTLNDHTDVTLVKIP